MNTTSNPTPLQDTGAIEMKVTSIDTGTGVNPIKRDGIDKIPQVHNIAGGIHAPRQAPAPTSVIDLPDEVKKNIVGYEDLELDELITRIVGTFSAAISCDRIVQLLWTSYGRNPARLKVMARLRLLCVAGAIQKVPGRRSLYRMGAVSQGTHE